MAEAYVRKNPNYKVTVILPARLRTNFLDELVSPCGMDRYISKDDFNLYQTTQNDSVKKKLRSKFMKVIDSNYDIMSFEKFRKTASGQSLKEWVTDMTQNKFIIIDEVHNLISDKYKEADYTKVKKNNKLNGERGINAILFRYLIENAHSSCRFIFLTATPVFDNISQFIELTRLLNPSFTVTKKKKIALKEIINNLQNKVSYFPGTSKQAYPTLSYQEELIPLSLTQDRKIFNIQNEIGEPEDDNKESYMVKQRMASLVCSNDINQVLSNIKEFAPKLKQLIKLINKPGKHVVYSNFIQKGLSILKSILKQHGWISFDDVVNNPNLWKKYEYKVFALWDGSVKDIAKTQIKSIINDPKTNLHGQKIRLILGSPSIKEGVSFKHVQHLHVLDPVWNISAKNQVEGRVSRFCSHSDIPINHSKLKRNVVVHIYKSTPRLNGMVVNTTDEHIYDVLIPRKEKEITLAENALKKIAIDYFLFRNMYQVEKKSSPAQKSDSKNSQISLDLEQEIKRKKNNSNMMNTCPKKRRPVDQICPEGQYIKKNNQGFDCCYKQKSKKKK